MSDHLPFEIQDKIMKLLPVRSLMQLRSVSKTWKSWIDSSDFVHSYNRQQKQMQHHLLVRYAEEPEENFIIGAYEDIFISIADDEAFPFNRVFLNSPPRVSAKDDDEYYKVIGCSCGLLCFYSVTDRFGGRAVIWNPSIRRAFEIDVPNVATIFWSYMYNTVLGFGVCPVTNDPKIIKITYKRGHGRENVISIPFQVELFTLSTRAWRNLSGNLPRILVQFEDVTSTNYSVAVDGFVYWLATDMMPVDGGKCLMIVSFDITREEFGEVNLPCRLARSPHYLTMSKLRESLVLIDRVEEPDRMVFNVWKMEDGLFTQLHTFNVNTPKEALVMGFGQRGDAMIEITDDEHAELVVYEQLSKQIDHLELDGYGHSFCVHPYMETLFLHDHPDLTVCTEAVQDNSV